MKISLIGCGSMGEVILSTLLDKGVTTKEDIFVSEISKTLCQRLEQKYGVAVVSDNRFVVGESDVVILAITPQNIAEVMVEIRGCLRPTHLVLSIVAGVTTNTLCEGLNHEYIARVMPNILAKIGEGISVWTAHKITEEQRGWVASILGAMGKEIYVRDELYIDQATVISGSGPAYVFLFIESLLDAALHIGLDYDMAQEIILETLLGSVHLIQKSGKSPAELRRQVTTPGGVASECIYLLKKAGFSASIVESIIASLKRVGSLSL